MKNLVEVFCSDEQLRDVAQNLSKGGYSQGGLLDKSISFYSHLYYGQHFMITASAELQAFEILTCTY